jgi:hypothetical protein
MFRLGETRVSAPRFCNSKQRLPVLGRPFAGNSLTFFGIPPIFFGILHGMHPSLFLRSLAQPTRRNAPEFRFHNFDACLAGT